MDVVSTIVGSAAAAMAAPHPAPVLELRQYKLVAGKRDDFVTLFERELIETQEVEGMELVGQFRDRVDQDRFTWFRSFPDMAARERALGAFYSGPTWQAHRNAANGMMIDSDNVLLLRPAWPGSGFQKLSPRPTAADSDSQFTVVTIHYLWQQPDQAFTSFFKDRFAPALERAGIQLDAALVREESTNNFPRLPVREGEKLFLWVTRAQSEEGWKTALARLRQDSQWRAISQELFDLEERPAQRLLLDPTPRSRFR